MKPYLVRLCNKFRHVAVQVRVPVDHKGQQCNLNNEATRKPLQLTDEQKLFSNIRANLTDEIEEDNRRVNETGEYQSFEIVSFDDCTSLTTSGSIEGFDDNNNETKSIFYDSQEVNKLPSIQEEDDEVVDETELMDVIDSNYNEREALTEIEIGNSLEKFASVLHQFILFEMNNRQKNQDDKYWNELQEYFSVLSYIYYRDNLFAMDKEEFRKQITGVILNLFPSDDDDYQFAATEAIIMVTELVYDTLNETPEYFSAVGRSDIFNSTPRNGGQFKSTPSKGFEGEVRPFLAYRNDKTNSLELWYSFGNDDGIGVNNDLVEDRDKEDEKENISPSGRKKLFENEVFFQFSYGKQLATKYLQKCSVQINLTDDTNRDNWMGIEKAKF